MGKGSFIGDLAERMGISPKTIRYYERLGLLAEPTRSESGYRVYGEADAERLGFILGAKALGLSLVEIKAIVAEWAAGEIPCEHVGKLLDEKLAELDRRIVELTTFRDQLRALKQKADATSRVPGTPCKHVEGVRTGAWGPTLATPVLGTLRKKKSKRVRG